MKIRLIGQRNNLGIGRHFTGFADALRRVAHWGDHVQEVDCTDQQALHQAAQASEDCDINICFVCMPLQQWFRGTNIQWIVFESDRIPDILMSTLQHADQIWVPSQWGHQVLVDHGLGADRCYVMPEGVDSDLYHPWRPRDNRLRFLLVGKYEQRKCIPETMQAWHQAFGTDTDVELVIKTDHFVDQDLKQAQLQHDLDHWQLDNVQVIWGALDQTDLQALYHSASVFVLPTRGEGWGLPLIEAAAMGLPIITTKHSGHVEYLDHIASSVLWVAHDMVPVSCSEYQHFYPQQGHWGHWAEPRVASLIQCLQQARFDIHNLRTQAIANSHIIRRQFSWQQSVDRVLSLLYQQGRLG